MTANITRRNTSRRNADRNGASPGIYCRFRAIGRQYGTFRAIQKISEF